MSGSDSHAELRALAQSILDRLEPAVRMAAARAQSAGVAGPCQQVWCPVCALAALISGEQHPLLDVVSEHSVALLSVVRALVDGIDTGDTGPTPPPEPDGPPRGRRRPIPAVRPGPPARLRTPRAPGAISTSR